MIQEILKFELLEEIIFRDEEEGAKLLKRLETCGVLKWAIGFLD